MYESTTHFYQILTFGFVALVSVKEQNMQNIAVVPPHRCPSPIPFPSPPYSLPGNNHCPEFALIFPMQELTINTHINIHIFS